MRRLTAFVFGLAVACATARGQIAIFAAEGQGPGVTVTIRANSVSPLDLLARIAGVSELRLLTRGGPEAIRGLDADRVDLDVKDLPLPELVQRIAGATGFLGTVDFGEKTLELTAAPRDDSPEALPFARDRAIEALTEAFGGDADPDREERLLLGNARLLVAASRWSEALDAYDKYVGGHRTRQDRAAQACLEGARCAILAERPDDAVRLTDLFLGEWPRHELQGKARLIHAEALAMRKEIPPAILMLESMVGTTKRGVFKERDSLIAEIQLADLHHQLGEDDLALKVLGQIDYRHDSFENVDLQGQVPLFEAICKRSAGMAQDAVDGFRVAALTCPTPALKVRALMKQAETLVDMGSPFEALSAVAVGAKIAENDLDRARFTRLQARALADLNLDEKAIEVLLSLLTPESLASLQPVQVEEIVPAAVSELGRILFTIRDWDRAIRAFGEVRRRGVAVLETSRMIARCHFEAGRYREALAEIRRLDESAPDLRAAAEYRMLEGDCWERLGLHERAVRAWTEADR